MHGLEDDYWGRVDFVYLDVDNRNNWTVINQRFGNRNSIPRFYLLSPDGTVVDEWVGVKSSQNLRQTLDWVVANYPGTNSVNTESAVMNLVVDSWRLYYLIRH